MTSEEFLRHLRDQKPFPRGKVTAYQNVLEECFRQDKMWGANRALPPTVWLTILVEEVGEVARAIQTEPDESLKAELTQVAAVAINWLKSLQ